MRETEALVEFFLISKKELPVFNLLLLIVENFKLQHTVCLGHCLYKRKWYLIYFWCQKKFIFAILNKKLCRCISLRKQKMFLTYTAEITRSCCTQFFFSRDMTVKIYFFMCKLSLYDTLLQTCCQQKLSLRIQYFIFHFFQMWYTRF